MFHQDKRLERIVPPRELCQKIPAGKFANSALVWQCTMFLSSEPPKKVWEVIPRSECFSSTPDAPAPTLEEILDEFEILTLAAPKECDPTHQMDENRQYASTIGGLKIQVTMTSWKELLEPPKMAVPIPKTATAALKLWFDVEGI